MLHEPQGQLGLLQYRAMRLVVVLFCYLNGGVGKAGGGGGMPPNKNVGGSVCFSPPPILIKDVSQLI